MLKKHTLEYYDAREVEKEIGIAADECFFAEDCRSGPFATLYCDDWSLQGLYEFVNPKATNEIKWVEYFRSLGYRDEVLIRVY